MLDDNEFDQAYQSLQVQDPKFGGVLKSPAPQQPAAPPADDEFDKLYKAQSDPKAAIDYYAQKYNVDPEFAHRIAQAESQYNQKAVSPKGARGVMQLMPETAKALGVNPDNMSENVEGGVKYLRQLLDKHKGDQRLAAADYNSGAVDKYDAVPPYKETQKYVAATAGDDDFDRMYQQTYQTPAPTAPQQQVIDPKFGGITGQAPAIAPQGALPTPTTQAPASAPFQVKQIPAVAPVKPQVDQVAYKKALDAADQQIQQWQQEYAELANSDDNSQSNQQNMRALKSKIDMGAQALVGSPEKFVTIGQRDQQRQQQQIQQRNAFLSQRKSALADAIMSTPETRMDAYKNLASYGPLSDNERRQLGVSQSDWKSYLDSFITGVGEFGAKAEGLVGRGMTAIGTGGPIGPAIAKQSKSDLANVQAYENIYGKQNVPGQVLHKGGELLPQAAGAVALAPETLALKLAYWSGSTAALGYGAGEPASQYLKEGALAIPAVVGAEGFSALGESLIPGVTEALGNTPTAVFVGKQMPLITSVVGNPIANGLLTKAAGGDQQAVTSSVILAAILSSVGGVRDPSWAEYGKAARENLRTADATAGNSRFQNLTDQLADVMVRAGEPEQDAGDVAASRVDKARRSGPAAIADLENMFRDIGELPSAPSEVTTKGGEPPVPPEFEQQTPQAPKGPTPALKPAGKALWEMTKQELADRQQTSTAMPVSPELLNQMHQDSIGAALARGETVRPEVLADFLDLAPKTETPASPTSPEAAQPAARTTVTTPKDLSQEETNAAKPGEIKGSVQTKYEGTEQRPAPPGNVPEVRREESPTGGRGDFLQGTKEEGLGRSGPRAGTEGDIGDTHPNQRSSDNRLAITQLFGDVGTHNAIVEHGFDSLPVNVQKTVVSRMVGALHNDEIFKRVIESVPVSVMNDFIGRELAPKELLHNKNMLLDRLATDSPDSVVAGKGSIINTVASVLSGKLTSPATKNTLVPDIGGFSPKGHATETASKSGATGNLETSPTSNTTKDVSPDMGGRLSDLGSAKHTSKVSHSDTLTQEHEEKQAEAGKPEVGQVFNYRNQKYRVDSVDDQHIRATDLSGKEGMRIFSRDRFGEITQPATDLRDVEHIFPETKPVKPGTTGLPPIEEIKSGNFHRQLSDFGPVAHRETNPKSALDFLPSSWSPVTQVGETYLSNTKNMALGQGVNKGVHLEFDTRGLGGKINTKKPGWEFTYGNGETEFTANDNLQSAYQKSLRRVEWNPSKMDTGQLKSPYTIRFQNALKDLVSKGWVKKKDKDGQITYTRPDVASEVKPNETSTNQGISPEVAENFKPVETEVAKPDSVLGQHIDAAISNPGTDSSKALHDAAIDALGHIDDPEVREQHANAIVDAAADQSKAGGAEASTGEAEPVKELTRLKVNDRFIHKGRDYKLKAVSPKFVRATDLTAHPPIQRVWESPEQFERETGFKLQPTAYVDEIKSPDINVRKEEPERLPVREERIKKQQEERAKAEAARKLELDAEKERWGRAADKFLEEYTPEKYEEVAKGIRSLIGPDKVPPYEKVRTGYAKVLRRGYLVNNQISVSSYAFDLAQGFGPDAEVDTEPKESTIPPTEASNEPATTQTRPARANGKAPLAAKPAEEVSESTEGERAEPRPVSSAGERQEPVRGESREGPASGTGEGAGVSRPHTTDTGERPAGTVREGSGERPDVAGSRPVAEVIEETEPLSQHRPAAPARGQDFFLEDPEHITSGGAKTKLQRNIAAIRLVRNITAEGRQATPEEQRTLAQFTGFGQFPAVFNRYAPEGKDYSKERDIILGRGDEPGLLEGPELAAAQRSTLNAHYTSPQVVKSIWDMARRLGFKGGRVLEPSMGIGNFYALMPRDLHGQSRLTGIELDHLTGQMARLLYPESNIQIKGFEKHAIPDNFYDLAVGNVPFGDYKVNDKDYNRYQANIHDYFFLRTLDKVRPGGLVMFITSTGTLDKLDPKIRQALADKADLVAAMRLPENTFQESAGTAVVTDLIILRKRLPDEKPKGDWVSLGELPDADGGEPIKINQYFEDNPKQILGTLDRRSRLYGKGSSHVTRTKDFPELFDKAINRLPKDVMSERPKNPVFEPNRLVDDGETKQGGFAIKDGKLYIKQGDDLIEQQSNPQTIDRIKGLLDVRDALRKVINAQLEHHGDTGTAIARKELNRTYDKFVKKHGFIHEQANARAIMDDPDKYVLLALEDWDPQTKKATKTAAFTQNTIRVYERPEKADNIGSAVGISLSEFGKVDLARIAGLTGQTQSKVAKTLVKDGLAFQNPNGNWETADIYLSGNVRQKLAQAQEAADADPDFQPNVDALSMVQPEDLDYTDIDARLGSPWVAPSDIAQFMADTLGGRPENFKVSYITGQGQWIADYARRHTPLENSEKARKIYGTDRANFMDVIQSALSDKPIMIYDGSGDTRVFNPKDSADANAKVSEIKSLFKEWLWEDEERRTRLHRYYNDNFNNIRLVKYDAQHYRGPDGQYRLPGMNPAISLRPHQANAVWQIVSQGRALLAHEVGTGKTFTMVSAAMEMRRMGLSNKPAIAVPKSIIEGFLADAQRLYPNARIITPGAKFTKDTRKQTVARIATGDYDLVVLTHDNLDMLPMHPDVVRDFVNRELDELEAAIRASKEEDASKGNKVVKQLEKAKAKLEARLKEAIEGSKTDDAVYFEHTGIDYLFVDEAHKYKSLPVYSSRQRVKGIPTSRSDRATNMLMRTRWLLDQNKNRGVTFATGTPVANTMVELYNMQKYLQLQDLTDRGIQAFDAWANTFGDTTTKMEVGVTGDYSPVTRFAKYSNLPELLALSRQIMDVQRVDDLGGTVVRPKRADEVVSIPISDSQKRYMADIRARAVLIKERKVEPKDDNMLKLSSDARKVSMDIRLVRAGREDAQNKAKAVAKEVLKRWKKQPTRTQMIFSDIGVHKTDWGFSVYDEISKLLVKGGIPKDKIIDFATLTEKQKTGAIERLATGKALVAIGGTDKLGTGVNAQKYLIALHHIDVPWLPAAVEQRDGRGWRQGNDLTEEGKPLDILRYVTTNSFDTFMWQLVDAKSRFIRQAMQGDLKQRVFKEEDGEELSPAKVMAIASGNPDLLKKVQVDEDVTQLQMAERRHTKNQNLLKHTAQKLEREQQPYQDKIDQYETDYKELKRGEGEKFSININDKIYDDREKAGKAIEKMLPTLPEDALTQIGEFRSWQILYKKGNSYLHKKGNNNYSFNFNEEDGQSTISSIEHIPQSIRSRIKHAEEQRKQGQADLEAVKKELGKPFKQADELAAKKAEQAELEKRLSETKAPTDEVDAIPFDPFDGLEPDEVNQTEPTAPDKDKYFLYNSGAKQFEEVKGAKPVEIPGFEDMDLYVHKTADGWTIGEGQTGMKVGGGKTRQAAIDDATKKLSNARPERLQEMRAEAVKQQGLSPRAEARKKGEGKPSATSRLIPGPGIAGGAPNENPLKALRRLVVGYKQSRLNAKAQRLMEQGPPDPGGWKATFSDVFTRNGAKLRAESREAFEAFIGAASSDASAMNILYSAIPAIEDASKMKFSNFALHLMESRLRGIRQRYIDIADEVAVIDDDDLVKAFSQDFGFGDILDNIAGKQELGKNLKEEAETLLSDGDLDGLRTFIHDRLIEASEQVAEIAFGNPTNWQKSVDSDRFQAGLAIYKQIVEKPIAELHAQNEGVFSDALGPLDTYFPLIAQTEEGELVGKPKRQPDKRAPLQKPKNINNRFATGLGDRYSPEVEAFQRWLKSTTKTDKVAVFYGFLEDLGITVPYKSGPVLPGYVQKQAGPYTRILKDGKTISVKARSVLVPKWLWREMEPLVEAHRLGQDFKPLKLFKMITGFGLVGLLEPAVHSANIIKNITGSTPFVFRGPLHKVFGSNPVTKTLDLMITGALNMPILPFKNLSAIVKLAKTKTWTEHASNQFQRLAEAGALPEKTRSVTFSKKISEQTGAKRSFSLAPILYGPAGLDTRARILMLDLLDQIKENPTKAEIYDWVNNLGIYNRALESSIGRFVKDIGIGPFYSASSNRLRVGIRSLIGDSDIPAPDVPGGGGGKGGGKGPKAGPGKEFSRGDARAYRIGQFLSTGIITSLALWALLYYANRRKWPWEEKEAKLWQIPLTDEQRASAAGQALYGPGKDTAYVGVDWSSHIPSATRALGVSGYFDTIQSGGNTGQAMEKSTADAINGLIITPGFNAPGVHAVTIGGFGVEPRFSLRDTQGNFGVHFIQGSPKRPPGFKQIGSNLTNAILGANGFLKSVAGVGGVGHAAERDDDKTVAQKGLSLAVNLMAPGLIKGTADIDENSIRFAQQRSNTDEESTKPLRDKLIIRLRNGEDLAKVRTDAVKAIADGKLKPGDLDQILDKGLETKFVEKFKALNSKEAINVFEGLSPEKQKANLPELRLKRATVYDLPDNDARKELLKRYDAVIDKLRKSP